MVPLLRKAMNVSKEWGCLQSLNCCAALLAHLRSKLLPMTKGFVHTAHKFTLKAKLLQQHGLCRLSDVAAV